MHIIYLIKKHGINRAVLLLGRYFHSHRHWLKTEWLSRRKQNPRFSVRAFARFLGLSSTTLSDILNGKRKLSRRVARTISKRMGVDPHEALQFLKVAENPTVEFLADMTEPGLIAVNLAGMGQVKVEMTNVFVDDRLSDHALFGMKR